MKVDIKSLFIGTLAILPTEAQRVASGEVGPTRHKAGFCDDDDDMPSSSMRPYSRRNGVAIVDIRGPLCQRDSWWWYDSHEGTLSRIVAALNDPNVGVVALDIDSCGGVVAGCFEAVQAARQAAKDAGKRIVSRANESAYSAAYAWATAGDYIALPDTGGVGSIGVLTVLLDMRGAAEQMGVKAAVIRSGEKKAAGHPLLGLDDATLADQQAEVDRLAGIFAALVGPARSMKPDTLLDYQGACFHGADAVAKGLADAVMTMDQFLSMAEGIARENEMKSIAKALGMHEGATESDIVAKVVELRAERDGVVTEAAATATAFALQRGAIDAAEVEPQKALIAAAPVAGIRALNARASKLPTPSKEAAPPHDARPPATTPSASDIDKQMLAQSDAALIMNYQQAITDPNGQAIAYWQSVAPQSLARARSLFERGPQN